MQAYFSKWGETGVVDLKNEFSKLVALTAARTLLGREIREQLFEEVGGAAGVGWRWVGWQHTTASRAQCSGHMDLDSSSEVSTGVQTGCAAVDWWYEASTVQSPLLGEAADFDVGVWVSEWPHAPVLPASCRPAMLPT